MDEVGDYGFHESTVTAICLNNKKFRIELDGVLVQNEGRKVELTVCSVVKVLVDDVESSGEVGMEAEDGEVLSLILSSNKLLVIIEWHDFSNNHIFTKSYCAIGDSVSSFLK